MGLEPHQQQTLGALLEALLHHKSLRANAIVAAMFSQNLENLKCVLAMIDNQPQVLCMSALIRDDPAQENLSPITLAVMLDDPSALEILLVRSTVGTRETNYNPAGW